MKIYANGIGHLTNIAATPTYGKKTFKNVLLQKQWADSSKTWHVALKMQAHHNLFKS